MKLTNKKAIELSILKWEWIVKNDGDDNSSELLEAIPELENIEEYCGLCHKYLKVTYDPYSVSCDKCPIDIIKTKKNNHTSGCWQNEHPFNIYECETTKENAQKVLDLIKSIK